MVVEPQRYQEKGASTYFDAVYLSNSLRRSPGSPKPKETGDSRYPCRQVPSPSRAANAKQEAVSPALSLNLVARLAWSKPARTRSGRKACFHGGMDWRSSERLTSRRPIPDGEVHLLEELGRGIAHARVLAGLSHRALAESALMHPTSIARIEYGTRRTRASALKRIAGALAAECADLDADALVESWLRLGGRAIAPESDFAERLEVRRPSRVSRKRSRDSRAQELLAYRNRRERVELNRQRSRSLLEVTLAYGRAETAAELRAVNKLIGLLEANFGIPPLSE